jgi:hypothetical protein
MHSGVGRREFECTAEFSAGRFEQTCLPLGVEDTHATYVSCEVTFRYEVSKDGLLQRGGVPIRHCTSREECVD